MRMIDLDDDRNFYIHDNCDDGEIWFINRNATVDAIPVSLIQSEIDFLTLAAEGEMEVTGQHGEVYAELAELKKLMSLWENEREKQNDS